MSEIDVAGQYPEYEHQIGEIVNIVLGRVDECDFVSEKIQVCTGIGGIAGALGKEGVVQIVHSAVTRIFGAHIDAVWARDPLQVHRVGCVYFEGIKKDKF